MANRFSNPNPQFSDDTGLPYEGGSLSFYGTQTSTPANTYSDATLTTANPNPLTLDAAGRSPTGIFLDPAVTYKVVLKDSAGNSIWTRDPVVDPAANVTAAVQVWAGNPNGSVAGNQGAVGGSGASMVWDITNQLLYICITSGTAATAVWKQVASTLSGAVQITGIITPSTLAANANDYNPTNLATAAIVRQAASTAVTITGLAGGATGRIIVIENISATALITIGNENTSSAAANRFVIDGDMLIAPNQSAQFWYDTSSLRWRLVGAFLNPPASDPGGRLAIQSGIPVPTGSVIDQTTVYYTLYKNNLANLYNGTSWYTVAFSELSQTLADATKSPAAAAATAVYDMFLWNDSGTLRCTRGPVWPTDTTRGTGAGTTELERVNGRLVNKNAITNGPSAQRGLYVGTISTDAGVALNMHLDPIGGAGGGNARLDVWNTYNRVPVSVASYATDDSWTYTTATWRKANDSAANRITLVNGRNDDHVFAMVRALASNSGTATVRVAVGLDTGVSPPNGFPGVSRVGATFGQSLNAVYLGNIGVGRHFLQWLEYSEASGTTTWYGDNASPTTGQAAIVAFWSM